MADWFIATEGVKVVKDSASVNATMFDRYLPFFMPAKILSLLMLSAFHHFIITDWRCVFGQHSSFTFLF